MANFELKYLKEPKKNRILGLAYPMRLDGVGGYLTQNENLGSLRDCVIQLIMTQKGARVMRPDFGTDVRSSLFEPLNAQLVENLRSQILEAIAKYEPRVIVKDLALILTMKTIVCL
jgi:phage baseplate assembly protein W